MIFPNLILDSIVQEADKIRFDASRVFAVEGVEITDINIYPDFVGTPATVLDVYVANCPEDWYLDWAYSTAGDYTVRVEVVTLANGSETKDYSVSAITAAEDALFSSDEQIFAREPELKRYIPAGRNSFKYMHRLAQKEMLDYMYRNGIINPDGTQIEKTQLIGDKLDQWAIYEVLLLIYQDIKNSNAEAFNEKLVDYSEKRADARKRYIIQYDSNKDGNVDEDDYTRTTRETFFSR